MKIPVQFAAVRMARAEWLKTAHIQPIVECVADADSGRGVVARVLKPDGVLQLVLLRQVLGRERGSVDQFVVRVVRTSDFRNNKTAFG